MPTIEDIILENDRRGVSHLRSYLPADYTAQAAQFILDNPGDTLIATGFYILSAGMHETDGPPGAIAIGNAMQALGRRVGYVSDCHTAPFLKGWLNHKADVIEFPITTIPASQQFAAVLLEQFQPKLLISIERCARTRDDTYLNMRAADISQHTARLDYLFDYGVPSVGIGDGGNEIGMGNLAQVIPGAAATLPQNPAITRVDRLVIASVSNWGGYGLVAELSRLVGRNLLPSLEEDQLLIRSLVDQGAVDGSSGRREILVDGFTLEENGEVLRRLHGMVG